MFFAWLLSTVVPREMIWEILGTPKSVLKHFLGQDIRDISGHLWHFDSVMGHGISLV